MALPSDYCHSLTSFTFVSDGPSATLEQATQGKRPNKAPAEANGKKTQQEDQEAPCSFIPPGPLHIVPSWQPLDANEKPPYSYATLIAHALLSSEHRRLTLSDIYQWITQHYPFYTMSEHGWQNSIRHNLSLNKAFVRLQRSSSQCSGKGSFWTIRPGHEQSFIDNLIKRRGPIRKQPVTLPRTLHRQKSSRRLNQEDEGPISTRPVSNTPLFTTFRMTPSNSTSSASSSSSKATKRKRSMPELHKKTRDLAASFPMPPLPPLPSKQHDVDTVQDDSDCDSGVDVGEQDELNKTKPRTRHRQLKKAKSTPCLTNLTKSSSSDMDPFFIPTPSLSFSDMMMDASWCEPDTGIPPVPPLPAEFAAFASMAPVTPLTGPLTPLPAVDWMYSSSASASSDDIGSITHHFEMMAATPNNNEIPQMDPQMDLTWFEAPPPATIPAPPLSHHLLLDEASLAFSPYPLFTDPAVQLNPFHV